jgi:hypothetical protein
MKNDDPSAPPSKQIAMRTNWKETALIVLSCSFILFVLVSYLPNLLANDDSAYYANQILALKPGWMDGKPAYIWIGHMFVILAQSMAVPKASMVLVLGVYSALFMSLTCVNLYFIFRSVTGRRYWGILPGVLVAFSPIGFSASTLIAPYPIAIFFATLAVASWLEKRFVTWSLAWGLAICSHASAILLAVVWLVSLLRNRDKRLAKRVLSHIPVTISICVVLFGWVVSFYPSLSYFIQFNIWVTNKDYMLPSTNQWLWNRLGALTQSDGFFLLGFATLGACLAMLRRLKGASEVLWWLAPYLTFYLFWGQGEYQKFYVFILPALAVLAVQGIDLLADELRHIKWKLPNLRMNALQTCFAVSLVLLTLLGGLAQGYASVSSTKTQPNEYSTLAIRIDRWATQQNITSDGLIIAGWEANYIIFYSHGLHVLGWYGTIFPSDPAQITYLILLDIDRAHAHGQRVFMTNLWYTQEAESDPSLSFASHFIADHYRIVETNDMLLEVI